MVLVRFGLAGFGGLRVYGPRSLQHDLRWLHIFLFYVLTNLILLVTAGPSGGHIFRCTTKDMEERRAKGLRPHWIPRG